MPITTMEPTDAAVFAFALEEIPGVGRVTAGRVLDRFGSFTQLIRFPHEQVLLRLKGLPNASSLVDVLLDQADMERRLVEAREQLRTLASRGVAVIGQADQPWPAQLSGLPAAHLPNLLYCYGAAQRLAVPGVAIIGLPPLDEEGFERAQDLVRHLIDAGIPLVTGLASGFDVVVHKLASAVRAPTIAVTSCGLARLPRPYRPVAATAVKQGGLLVSGFSMAHGPFDHDERDRCLLQAALARATVVVEPEESPLAQDAVDWALHDHRPVFSISSREPGPSERLHVLRSSEGFDWVVAAMKAELPQRPLDSG